jgi:hypothetical protein
MYYHVLRFASLGLVLLCGAFPATAQTQSAPAAPPPAIRRWLDVQSVVAATRYRWTENSAERVTTSAVQWQAQLRARLLFDGAGRYHVGTFMTTGPSFRSGWNSTGAGLGPFTHFGQVRHLYFSAEPVKRLELQVGGMAVNRGELADVIASDNDSFIVAERATYRPAAGRITQLSLTSGHFDSVGEPNVFKQFGDMDDVNYGQALVGVRLTSRAAASFDYTYEDGRDILREGLVVRMPPSVNVLTQVRLESYQRVDPDRAAGFNASVDLRVKKLTGTVGAMSADRNYGPFNGDRYEAGTRVYYIVNYPLTPALQLQWFHTNAFDVDFPLPIKQRFDFVLTFNPTAALKRARVF